MEIKKKTTENDDDDEEVTEEAITEVVEPKDLKEDLTLDFTPTLVTPPRGLSKKDQEAWADWTKKRLPILQRNEFLEEDLELPSEFTESQVEFPRFHYSEDQQDTLDSDQQFMYDEQEFIPQWQHEDDNDDPAYIIKDYRQHVYGTFKLEIMKTVLIYLHNVINR